MHVVERDVNDTLDLSTRGMEIARRLGTACPRCDQSAADEKRPSHCRNTLPKRHVGLHIFWTAADQGRSLSEVADVARRVNAASRSMGVALTSCTVPAVGHPTFELSDTEIEVGIGIHGEPGRQRMPMQPARAVAELMLDPVLSDLDFSGDDGVILFVNSMGATPLIELYVMYAEFAAILDKAGVSIARSLVGPYITSLDMAGCSVTLLRADDELLRLWDHPVNTPALRRGC